MSMRFAILGLLAEQPLHGYAIQSALLDRLADFREPGCGDVYRALNALARDGLVACAAARVGKRPHRKVYAITARGRRELRAWLVAPPHEPAGSPEDLILRLLVAERCAGDLMPTVVAAHAARRRAELAELLARREARHAPASFAALLRVAAVEVGIRHVRASLEAIEMCRLLLARHRTGIAAAVIVREMSRAGASPAAPVEPGAKPSRRG